jgi:glycosyltransferase involved in cell wall biosynthesis
MACGAPPVVPDDGAFPEVVRDGGLTVGPTDLAGWAAAISALFRSTPLRVQLSNQARALATGFSAERAARRILALLEPGERPEVDERVDAGDEDRRH